MMARPDRVALVVSEYLTDNFSGGLAIYTYRIAQGLKEAGVSVEVFFPGKTSETFFHDGVLVHRIDWRSGLIIRAIRKIVHLLRSKTLDNIQNIVLRGLLLRKSLIRQHKQTPFAIIQYTHLEGLGVWRLKVPTVIRLSSYFDLWASNGQLKAGVFGNYLEDKGLRNADGVFGPGRYVAEFVGKKLNIETRVIESPFIPQRIDEDAVIFNQHLRGIRYGLYYGAFVEYKGVYVLTEAVDAFLEDHQDYNFVWVGPNRPGYSKNGKAVSEYILNKLSHHKDRVIYFKAQEHSKLFPIISGAQFVAMPSLAENFSNASIETMSLGQILIGTNGRTFEQLIQHGINGYLCEPDDVASLLSSMKLAATLTPQERTEMGELARERVLGLNPEIIVSQLLDFYSEIISKNREKVQV